MEGTRFAIETLGPATHPTPLEKGEGLAFTDDEDRLPLRPHLSALKDYLQGGAKAGEIPESFELAGARARLFFDPAQSRAAIVTCGGLCPGLNAVIRGLVMELWHQYGCRDILGIPFGYNGLAKNAAPPIRLDPARVRSIHSDGGSMLGSSRGTPPTSEIVDTLVAHGVNMLFPIGGDGTMRGALAIHEEVKRRSIPIAVVGIPKTIDNDIPFVRRSFGFETAVGVATQAIHAAHAEAEGAPRGLGLVKLMGRNSGYIAATASLAAGHANFCLVPEVPFGLDGKGGLLDLIEQRIEERGHAVVVAAEGAGQDFFKNEPKAKDASGNVKLGDIGRYLKDRIAQYFEERGKPVSLKYIDPTYMIRAVAANPADQLLCTRFAHNAVHAAMAGKTGMLIGYWHGQLTHVPLKALGNDRQSINPRGELWWSVLETTGQPAYIGRPPA